MQRQHHLAGSIRSGQHHHQHHQSKHGADQRATGDAVERSGHHNILVTHQLDEAVLLGQKIIVMHSDSTVWEFDLSGEPYPRDLSAPQMQQLQREITDECRKAQA